ncbi:E3 ubiquitin-protein ligase RNF169 isoform X1 [Mus musculus]|uniref:E3 ubiquitin-protein ligase RNF169 isoform X1 n=1 Tax=Mus musculus TaxID=10090 RepID=UPI0003D77175|nr:E3 ubiquitin-protein ligase RNF169 isoform X1 [Mus musculus]|eukprot:XP_006507248.1 PREDICTED: E3 ubiquitin-protein ligase RNF169 isoform X1 [Mus musculus]
MNMQIAVRRALPRPLLLSHRNRLSLQTGNKMAAAGPSTRASSAAAAAALSRRGRRGRCDEMAAAKAGAPGPASSPALLVLRSAPRPEESGCTGCLETPGEVAALPCSHSRCRGCASRAAGPGCRRCRPRGSGWARRRARDDGQAAAELMGERARRGQPEPCRPRRDGGAAASGPRPEPEPLAEPEFIFRTPIKLSKPGELSEEYGCLRKCPARLSDSENEEPSRGQMMQTHRSAFVSKNSSCSLAFLAGKLNTKVQRSQSCSDTVQDRVRSRLRTAPPNRAKITTITPGSTPIIGVLLSTQNNRCLSAPDLTIEKRLPFGSLSSLASLHKPERSISPESNDSISEELNHFKPIVCSPCTPPKRLPDGRVLSPLIIKSTPRNLTRSLQKQTSYEASPRILKKWEQIFQERQIKKTLSKATLTSLAPEAGEEFPGSDTIHSSKERPSLAFNTRLSRVQVLSECAGPTSTALECFPSVNQTKVEQDCVRKRSREFSLETCHSSEHGGASSGPSLEREQCEESGSTVDATLVKTCISTVMKTAAVNSLLPKNDVLGGVLKTKQQLKTLNHFDLGNGILVNSLGEEPIPSLRRGRKRRCKTKHLEQNGVKKLRPPSSDMDLAPKDPGLLEVGRKLQQEEEDQQLALQSHRMFDSERRTMSRRKGSVDQYLLRSSSLAGAK